MLDFLYCLLHGLSGLLSGLAFNVMYKNENPMIKEKVLFYAYFMLFIFTIYLISMVGKNNIFPELFEYINMTILVCVFFITIYIKRNIN